MAGYFTGLGGRMRVCVWRQLVINYPLLFLAQPPERL